MNWLIEKIIGRLNDNENNCQLQPYFIVSSDSPKIVNTVENVPMTEKYLFVIICFVCQWGKHAICSGLK